jgi:hypothetical protein
VWKSCDKEEKCSERTANFCGRRQDTSSKSQCIHRWTVSSLHSLLEARNQGSRNLSLRSAPAMNLARGETILRFSQPAKSRTQFCDQLHPKAVEKIDIA